MADVAMCSGEGCEVRNECYRHVAKVGAWQVWFHRPPRDKQSCLWIIPTGDDDDGGDHV